MGACVHDCNYVVFLNNFCYVNFSWFFACSDGTLMYQISTIIIILNFVIDNTTDTMIEMVVFICWSM